MTSGLTHPDFIRKLETLHLLARKVLGGSLQARRRTTRRGAGIAFADYAPYHPGDDYRAIDWRVFARFESLLIKLFELEEDTTLHLVLDTSRSMAAKQERAAQVAAALGYIALHCHDRVALHAFGARLQPLLDPARGRAQVWSLLRALGDLRCEAEATDLAACCRQLHARHRRRGLVLLLSDFLCPGGYEEALGFLTWAGHEVFCLQLLDPADLAWDWTGDCDLACVESGDHRRLTITSADARRFEQAVRDWNAGLERCCRARGIGLASTLATHPFEAILLDLLSRGGLVAT